MLRPIATQSVLDSQGKSCEASPVAPLLEMRSCRRSAETARSSARALDHLAARGLKADDRIVETTFSLGHGRTALRELLERPEGLDFTALVCGNDLLALGAMLECRERGIRVQHLLDACVDEFRENEDLPNTTNPDDWARISGKKGERIVFIRTLIQGKKGSEAGRSIATVANTGQYL